MRVTTIYFIRHAQANSTILDQQSRPLTIKGLHDSLLLAKRFTNVKIDLIFSSPYKRTIDTVKEIAAEHNLTVKSLDDLRGLRIQSNWISSYRSFFLKYWDDFSYHYADGESFAELQNRSIAVLQKIINDNRDKTIIISTHSVSMAVMIKYYDSSFDFEDFIFISDAEPYIVKMCFDEHGCVGMKKTGLPSFGLRK